MSLGVDRAVNLTATPSTASPINLAMPRLLSLHEASNSPPSPPFTKSQVPDETTSWRARGTWISKFRAARPSGLARKPQTLTSPWSYPASAGSIQTLRACSSTSLTGARQLQPSTTATTDSIPPIRIARPQHLQAQMKQALNPSKMSIIKASISSPLSTVTSTVSSTGTDLSHLTTGGERPVAKVAAENDRTSSGAAVPTPKLHTAKSSPGVNSDQSTLVALKLAVAERRHSTDSIPISTLKVDTFYLLTGIVKLIFLCTMYVLVH